MFHQTLTHQLFWPLLIVLHQAGCAFSDQANAFDFDNTVTVQTHFKFYLSGGEGDCFFQPVAAGGRFDVTYSTFGGKDVEFFLMDQLWEPLAHDTKSRRGGYIVRKASEGTYAVCFSKQFSFTSVIVYLSMVTYEVPDSNTTIAEGGELTSTMEHLKVSLSNVRENTWEMKRAQVHLRISMTRDTSNLKSNQDYVFRWSLAQCIIIVAAAFIQVYSIRYLFNPKRGRKPYTKLQA